MKAPRAQHEDVATQQSKPLRLRDQAMAMPDEDSDKSVLLFGSLAFARPWGFIPSLS